ncbi:helix-turn-helix domain-containing protein [Mycolicibacterium komossense]|uniref:Helix-turn-helix transcriptional regulator n=1 Tax=Mycolicibacterium komossense TaxID=1779 RepID=A0ABT3CAR7_9MYCO|nr:XRE family transcriptional regulator [Mycolicibacterium komossense]MCV7226583.1 helix-turn-helix transcriptional regulator [Mycolicibacterium komossense]
MFSEPAIALSDSDAAARDQLGNRLRQARERARLSTRDVASRAGVSAGFISQLENGKCGVSVGVLKRISAAVGISVADLLADEAPVARPVLRAHERPVFSSDGGLQKLLLSRPPLQQLEVYEGTFEVGGSTGPDAYAHDNAQELFYVLTGHLEISIAAETLILGPRDSVEYLSSVPHRVVNIGATPAQAMWITSHFTPPLDTNPLSALPAHQMKE